jgi:hypothetical protein
VAITGGSNVSSMVPIRKRHHPKSLKKQQKVRKWGYSDFLCVNFTHSAIDLGFFRLYCDPLKSKQPLS